MATTVTPAIRFAAARFVHTFRVSEQYMARRPSLVEGFPGSYSPELVERAQSLLVRMATPIVDLEVLAALRADLAAFHADVDAQGPQARRAAARAAHEALLERLRADGHDVELWADDPDLLRAYAEAVSA